VPWFGVWHVMQRNLFGTSIWKMQTKCSWRDLRVASGLLMKFMIF
jgi:hypothetical protein